MISHYRRTALQKNPCKWITIKLSSSFWGPWPVGEGDEKSKVEFTCLATSPELTGTWETRILVVSLFVWSQWKEMYRGNFQHWIFQLEGFSHHSIIPDELHIIYLGTAQYLWGSMLWLLVYNMMTETPAQNMEKRWAGVSEVYRDKQ